jgi:CRP/FNR family transcriptional regulator, anaerobic regulatory protein
MATASAKRGNESSSHIRLVSHRKNAACSSCYVRQSCLLSGVSDLDLAESGSPISAGKTFRAGEHMYSQGDQSPTIYSVRTGSVKTITLTNCGVEQVQGFYLVGDIFGLDSIAEGRHTCSAIALEDTTVCSVPLPRMQASCMKNENLLQGLLVAFGRETAMQFNLRMLMSHSGAVQRLATFLTSLASRLGSQWLSDTELWLSMSRHDIASYLGTATETVSRALSRLVREGVLTVANKRIRIDDPELLRLYAEVGPPDMSSRIDRMESCRELRV